MGNNWVPVATPTPASHGTEHIIVGKDAGQFSQLRITAAKGNTVVKKVVVYFVDGAVKTVKMNERVRDTKVATIDLGKPRAIDRILVTTEKGKGEYAVYGSSEGGEPVGGVMSSR